MMTQNDAPIAVEVGMPLQVDVLHREYASRKFAIDCKQGKISIVHWYQRFRKVVEEMSKYADRGDDCEALECLLRTHNIEDFFSVLQKNIFIYEKINRLIVFLHDDITDNPEFDFQSYISARSASEKQILSTINDDILYLRNVCLEYGYFPRELITRTHPLTLIKGFKANKLLIQNPFIRFYQYSGILSAHFVSRSGKCYFEDEIADKFYIYYNSSDFFKFEDALKRIHNNIKKRGKKNFTKQIILGENCNIQICVNNLSAFKNTSTDEIIKTIEHALCCAIMYFEFPVVPGIGNIAHKDLKICKGIDSVACAKMISFFKKVHEAYRNIQELKYKKISFIKRCIGLQIWDNVSLMEKNISGEIKKLMDCLKHDVVEGYGKFSALKDDKIFEFAEIILEDYDARSSKKGKNIVPEFRDFRREFDITRQCIETLSICAH